MKKLDLFDWFCAAVFAVCLLLCFLGSGKANAADWTREDARWEATWQALHFVDALQTDMMLNRGGYEEVDAITSRVIGAHPSRAQSAAWSIAVGVGHFYVTKRLVDGNAPRWVRRGWQLTTISLQGNAVIINWSQGLRP